MTQINDSLNWRYATKAYNTNKKLTEDQVNTLIESIRLSPSSYGLQPYKVIDVETPEIREKLKAAAWNQTQITDASQLLVFAVPTDLSDQHVDTFIENVSKTRVVTVESLKEYSDMIKGPINSRTPDQRKEWSAKQAYIALGILLKTAADMQVDSTPMEGFDSVQFDDILGLKEKNLTSVVACTLGYRSEDDIYAKLTKVRVSKDDLIIKI
jgi:nitroreductase